MTYGSAASAYRKTELVTSDDPKQLILLLYNGAIRFLETAKCGIHAEDINKRGENLSKAIAVISELNASLDMETGGEAAEFLRGMYMHMMVELPKVSIDNNVKTIDHVIGYLKELKRLWEERVMGKPSPAERAAASQAPPPPVMEKSSKKFSVAI